MWNAAEKLLNFSPILHVSTGQIHKEAQYLHWKTQVKAGNALQNCSGQRIEHWNKRHSLTTWIPTNVTNISPQLYKSLPSSSVPPGSASPRLCPHNSPGKCTQLLVSPPFFFSQETVCVYLKLPQMTAYTTSHTVQKVCKTIKTSKQYRQVFFARSIAPFSLLCLHWSSISGRWCHKLRKKKKLLKELHEPHYNCKRQKQKDKYKVKVFLHTYQPSIYTKLLQAL